MIEYGGISPKSNALYCDLTPISRNAPFRHANGMPEATRLDNARGIIRYSSRRRVVVEASM